MAEFTSRRRWPRHAVTIECRIDGLSNRASIRLIDLSLGGGYVDTSAVFAVGDPVSLVAVVEGVEMALRGRVVHVNPGMGFALAFDGDQMSEETHQRLKQLFGTA